MVFSLLVALIRGLGALLSVFLATLGSWGLGFGVMTACTNTTTQCTAPHTILIVGWVVQGLLGAVAVAVLVPAVAERCSRPALAAIALSLPLAAVAVFTATGWAASNSYCLDGQTPRDYCDAEL